MNIRPAILSVFAVLGLSHASGAPSADVAAPARRAVTVDLAARLTGEKPEQEQSGAVVNPFAPSGSREDNSNTEENQAAARAAVLASNRTLLAALAEQLEPKGTFVIGGESIILLGQKKLKVGEVFPITFEGAVYELQITGIETTRFSVRYKNEEITRPIVTTKSGK